MTDAFFERLTLGELRERRGIKWRHYPDDVLPAWIADQDFPTAPPVREALERLIHLGDLGYPLRPEHNPLPRLFAERMARRYGWPADPLRTRVLTDVLQALELVLSLYGDRGDGVIVQTPIYPPFLGAVRSTGKRLVENRLVRGSRGWELDLDGLRRAAGSARALLLCNPHNPSGRVFTRSELEEVAAVAVEHDLLVVADEIHQDLVYSGHRHLPLASLGEEIARRTVTLTSATKSFNIAGLCCAVAHFGLSDLLAQTDELPPHYLGRVSIAGIEATAAAWSRGEHWLQELVGYLERNRDFMARFLDQHLPSLGCFPPEAGYLAWLDCRSTAFRSHPHRFFLARAKVALSDGPDFGAAGRGFVRLNFATSRSILTRILERMAAAVEDED